MSIFGAIGRSLINPMSLMQIAMGPAGWASLAMKTIGSQIAMNVLQKLGEQMGLPKPMIDMAQAAFANASGQPGLARQNMREAIDGMSRDFNLSPAQTGELQRAATKGVDDLYEVLSQAAKEGKDKAERGNGKSKGGSWLREVAALMSKALDSKIDEMKKLAGQIDKSKTTALQNDLQVATQEFSFLMNSVANMIKTVGEGLTTMARKG